jgi:glyoxylase-like metal-dependent hydrolase (beta-lactamase superfamily II)/8-oxo-dGTP pyrophosphatase MutT (NUDIX family)
MARPEQQLHLQREPTLPRPAATVLLLRDSPQGIEVLMTRRSLTASFAPGAYVFPGGGIDALDAQSHSKALRRPTQSDLHLTQAIAAIRESFEELGILLAYRADHTMADAQDIAQLVRNQPFADQCKAQGMKLAADQVFVLAHWITDRDLPKRFDVPFLVARMPEGQTPVADESEQFEPVWVRPADALKRHEAGEFFIIFPTIRTLQRLTPFTHVQAVLDACAVNDEPLWTSCPRAGWLAGIEERYMEHEPPYGELALVSPDGQIVHHLDWQSEQPVALLKNVHRLTAPNPGVMTGPGTNTYWVGDPLSGFVVIDPGPADSAHLERIWRATGGQIRMIVCTHSHADHSPGAKPLQSLCKAQTGGVPPILGLSSASTANAQSQFKPDRELEHGEILRVGEHSLKVLHTPGHAANHVCLALLEDGLLFTGDHVLNGSTTVVNPPDGSMNDYLDSLDLLAHECQAHQLAFILPAHGYVLGFASQAIAQLKAHRLKREAKVIAAMRALPHGSLTDWVAHAYDDVPERLWPVAARSLQAHVERIQSMPPGNH